MNKISTLKVPGGQQTCPVHIDARDFPDHSPRGDNPPCTIDNVRYMLERNRVAVRYNIIKKRTEITVPWSAGTLENADAVALTHILSMASRYSMPTSLVPAMVEAIGDECSYNPAADWINSVRWDGTDRLPDICATITPVADYPTELRDTVITKWLLSAAAAALLPSGFRSRGVLTLQGGQGIGKTSWGLRLIGDERLRDQLIKVDHHLDAGNKDSQLGAIDHWIVEVGELDSSLKRDVSRLKGFLTSGSDKIRRPYARTAVETQRRTVFYATVNATDFLVDSTGNTRFWTIACEHIDYDHDINMQQVFAQCAAMLKDGAVWWLTAAEEQLLERRNSLHRSFSVVRDRVAAIVDLDAVDLSTCPSFTATEVLELAGLEHASNTQAKECASLLREWFGDSRRIHGRDKWRVPMRPDVSLVGVVDDTDRPKPKSKFD